MPVLKLGLKRYCMFLLVLFEPMVYHAIKSSLLEDEGQMQESGCPTKAILD